MKKRLFIQNAVILTLCSLFLSALGMAFRVYQSNLIGAEGMGLLQLLLSVYYFATNLAVSGLNLAVTRLVSESAVSGNGASVERVLRKCLGLCLLFGISTGLALFLALRQSAAGGLAICVRWTPCVFWPLGFHSFPFHAVSAAIFLRCAIPSSQAPGKS